MPPKSPRSAFLADLYRALDADWASERDLTARVATLSALGFSLPQMASELNVSAVRIRNAIVRLRRIAPQLVKEKME